MVAVVPQSYYVDYDFTVEDIVMMGRNPYIDFHLAFMNYFSKYSLILSILYKGMLVIHSCLR